MIVDLSQVVGLLADENSAHHPTDFKPNVIQYNLEVAKPKFLYFIHNLNYELRQWIQYNGLTVEGNKLYFKFKSSENSLSFKVYAGVNVGNIEFILDARTNEIYEYFKQLKNNYDNSRFITDNPL